MRYGRSRHELERRAQAVAAGSWGSAAVRTVVDEMTAAVTAVIVAATVAGSV